MIAIRLALVLGYTCSGASGVALTLKGQKPALAWKGRVIRSVRTKCQPAYIFNISFSVISPLNSGALMLLDVSLVAGVRGVVGHRSQERSRLPLASTQEKSFPTARIFVTASKELDYANSSFRKDFLLSRCLPHSFSTRKRSRGWVFPLLQEKIYTDTT
jgi:hypothetical protein